MSTIKVFDQSSGTTRTISFNLRTGIIADDLTGSTVYYIDISTDIPRIDGTSFPAYTVESLSDIPPGYVGDATNFSNLCGKYITYFLDQSELIESSSSSEGYSSSSSSTSLSSASSESSSSSSESTASSDSSNSSSSTSESSSSGV